MKIADGLLKYANTKKSREWSQSIGLQLPKEATTRGNSNLHTEQDIVNRGNSSFSISTRADQERVQAELEKRIASSPTQRTKIFENAKRNLDRVWQSQERINAQMADVKSKDRTVARREMDQNISTIKH